MNSFNDSSIASVLEELTVYVKSSLTEHASIRMKQRGISTEDIAIAIGWGQAIYQNESCAYFITKNCLRNSFLKPLKKHFDTILNLAVIFQGGRIITTFKNKNLKNIKKVLGKKKYLSTK